MLLNTEDPPVSYIIYNINKTSSPLYIILVVAMISIYYIVESLESYNEVLGNLKIENFNNEVLGNLKIENFKSSLSNKLPTKKVDIFNNENCHNTGKGLNIAYFQIDVEILLLYE